MQTPTDLAIMMWLLLIITTLWIYFSQFAEESSDGHRRRRHSLDFNEFELTMEGLNISPDKVVPKELALFAATFDREILISCLNEVREY